MGCMSSREAKLDRRRSLQPSVRSHSMPVVHGSKDEGDSFHVVSLTYSTLGSLRLDPSHDFSSEEMLKEAIDCNPKNPKSIAGCTDHVEPQESINAWELMEGLEEEDTVSNLQQSSSIPQSSVTSIDSASKPFWMQTTMAESGQLDPEVISNFRKAMTELSPQHPSLLRCRSLVRYRPEEIPKFPGIVKARVAAFQQKIDERRASFKSTASLKIPSLEKPLPDGKRKVVLYLTSLRGVRKTYEDCCNSRLILQSYGVRIDERDVSMHRVFRDELNEILGTGTKLPKVFANGRCLGGAEEMTRMHECGELMEALKDCELASTGMKKGCDGVSCEGCGDCRFVPCEMCSGSCKVFVEEEEEDDGIRGFRKCVNCNENGLVRCPLCC